MGQLSLFRRHYRIAWAVMTITAFAASGVQASAGKENLVKAAFVYNFTKLVEWSQPHNPILMCFDGAKEYGKALKQIEKRSIKRQSYKYVKAPSLDINCQLFTQDQTKGSKPLRKSDELLTIGEGEEFIKKGGMIAFINAGGKIRFIINLPAAQAAGLSLNPQLLEVAHKVVR